MSYNDANMRSCLDTLSSGELPTIDLVISGNNGYEIICVKLECTHTVGTVDVEAQV